MREYHYQLSREDYLDWIRWNIKKHDQKKIRYITAAVFVAILGLTLVKNVMTGGSAANLLGSIALFAVVGAAMIYFISPQNQERMIWKRSGLKKMEKEGFPRVELTLREDGIDLYGPDRQANQVHFQYTDLTELTELDHLYLLGAKNGSFQFVAKSAFSNPEEEQEFKDFVNEKLADARENPEKYKKDREQEAQTETDDGQAYVVRNKDTGSMGKIGQMAHLLAPSGDDEEKAEEDDCIQTEREGQDEEK